LLSNTPEQGTLIESQNCPAKNCVDKDITYIVELTEVLFVDLAVLLEEKVCGAPFEHVCEPLRQSASAKDFFCIKVDEKGVNVHHKDRQHTDDRGSC
jgi:hypothetical protein